MVLVFSLVTSYMIEGMGIVGTFATFSGISAFGGIYYVVKMASTQGLSQSDCKKVYWPEDLRVDDVLID